MEKQYTESGKSYWGGNGLFQETFNRYREDFVPQSGKAETQHGELIRCIGNLFYDFCNNGNCNALEFETHTCPDCGGGGYEESDSDDMDDWEDCHTCGGECSINGDLVLTDSFKEQFEYIKNTLPSHYTSVKKLEAFLTDGKLFYDSYTFNDEQMGIYNAVVDEIIHYIFTTTNCPR